MSHPAENLAPEGKEAIATVINQAVAETVVTTMLAQNFHWNVTGMAFGPLHALFQEIYEDHFEGQDDLAERCKAIGGHAEGRLAKMVSLSKVSEHDGHADAETMVKTLSDAQKTVSSTLAGLADIAEKFGDLKTQDLAIERGRAHEKFAWILDAHLPK